MHFGRTERPTDRHCVVITVLEQSDLVIILNPSFSTSILVHPSFGSLDQPVERRKVAPGPLDTMNRASTKGTQRLFVMGPDLSRAETFSTV